MVQLPALSVKQPDFARAALSAAQLNRFRGDERRLQAGEQRRAALAGVVPDLVGGSDTALGRVAAVDPGAALEYAQNVAKTKKGASKLAAEKAETAYRLLSAVNSSENPEAAYQAARQQYVSIYPDDAANVPEKYDPAYVRRGVEMGSQLFAQDKPSAVLEHEYFMSLTPDQREQYLAVKRARPTVDLGGTVRMPSQVSPAGPPVAEFPKTLKPGERPETQREQAEAKATGAEEGKRAGQMPQLYSAASSALNELEIQQGVVLEDIDRVLDRASFWTTGLMGSAASRVPGTPAYDLAKLLDGIRANIGFDKLQAMREASPTGGALGQVSERENTLLQSVLGSVEQSQTEEQFRKNLKRLRGVIEERRKARMEAFERDFGQAPQDAESGAQETVEYDYVPGQGLVPRSN